MPRGVSEDSHRGVVRVVSEDSLHGVSPAVPEVSEDSLTRRVERSETASAGLEEAVARMGLNELFANRAVDGLITGQRRLSDGEAVRLSVARAWLSAPDVLVVDDAFSALDPATAASVTAGVFGGTDGPARVYAGTRIDPAAYAETVVLCRADGVEVRDRAAVTVEWLGRCLPRDEATRWAATLGRPARPESSVGGAEKAPGVSARRGVLDGVGLEADVPAPRLREVVARLADLYPRWVLTLLGVLLVVLVVTELAVAGTLGAARVNLTLLVGLTAVALLAEGGYRFVVRRGAMGATRRLHRRILAGMLDRGLAEGSATAAGRFTDDFTTVELWSPGILLSGVRAVLATSAAVTAMVLAAPVAAVGVVVLAVAAVIRYPALRRASVRGRALLAATRGPLRTYAGAVLTCRSFRSSSALRPGFAARFRELLAREHLGLYAAHGTRMAIVASVEAAGVILFAATVAAATWAPVGWSGLLAVAVYAAYVIGERFAAVVEAHQEVDGTTQVMSRVFALLPAAGDRAEEAVPATVKGRFTVVRGPSGAGKSTLLRAMPGRLVENEPPPLPIPLDELCPPESLALADDWSHALGLPTADKSGQLAAQAVTHRQLVALAVACAEEPDVLLIDETTSAFSPAAERRLLTLVRERLPKAAIVVVLHRPDNVDLADHVVDVGQRRSAT
ncbi:hypothetical protein JKJ07_24325 [Actinoplanes sp. LDG1-01]|uniref:ABC transmembrane type-1 domain-containing protein n=1 Tax=Paractinoplanes lichenicola TaxID=2802976 RepID=A0ABS1VSG5_9ACTN|nr:hypothetical protein [Actinoplanes lichenicola]